MLAHPASCLLQCVLLLGHSALICPLGFQPPQHFHLLCLGRLPSPARAGPSSPSPPSRPSRKPLLQKLQKPWQQKETNGIGRCRISRFIQHWCGLRGPGLSTRSLFSATFIPYRVLFLPWEQPRLPLPQAEVFLPKKLSKQGYRSEAGRQCLEHHQQGCWLGHRACSSYIITRRMV